MHFSWFDLLGLPHLLEKISIGGETIELLSHGDAVAWLDAWVVCFIMLGLSLMARMGLKRARKKGGTMQFVPDGSMTSRNFFELIGGALHGLSKDLLGKDVGRFYWLTAGLFIYVLFGNLIGMVPGMLPPTGSMNHNASMALVVILVFNGAGLMVNRLGYVKHMAGPWLGIAGLGLNVLLLSIETMSFLIVRPYSLSLRLMGNMFGDHLVFGIMSDLVPVIYPCLFLALGMLVSLIQAFVFMLLSTIYIALAVAHDDGH